MIQRLTNKLSRLEKLERNRALGEVGPALRQFTLTGEQPRDPRVMAAIRKIIDFENEIISGRYLPWLPPRPETEKEETV
jgi:hypothetical protein